MVVYVVVIAVNPVGQMSIYDVATAVIIVLGPSDLVTMESSSDIRLRAGRDWSFRRPGRASMLNTQNASWEDEKGALDTAELDIGLPEIIVIPDVVGPGLLDNCLL